VVREDASNTISAAVDEVCGVVLDALARGDVPTADARLLPGGTAYISDVGMTGPRDSVIGFRLDTVLPRFLRHLPTRFEVAEGPVSFNGALIEADRATGRARSIELVQRLIEV